MYTKPLQKISKRDVSVAGGKGANLGELIRAGIPVPDGFVILSSAFEQFLQETDIGVEIRAALDEVDHKKIHTVERAAERIKPLVLSAQIPRAIAKEIREQLPKLKASVVAVRSSAIGEDGARASWAGQLESFLGVSEKNLLRNVQRCWASLFTPRAIFYRYAKNIRQKNLAAAVVVQKMVSAEVSGVCFTAHPISGDRRQAVIEAVYGLGEGLVGGRVTPDTYVVRKDAWEVIDVNAFTQKAMVISGSNGKKRVRVLQRKQSRQKLTDREIITLAKLCERIEKHQKRPQDIEWAFARGKFFILQARPITS